MVSLQITVNGKVQGVWFRKYTQEKALKLRLNGYVTNKSDGSVFIEVSGAKKTVNIFTLWLENEGSPLSKVTGIEIIKLNTQQQFNSFDIRR